MTTLELIQAYLLRVDDFVTGMKNEYGVENLLVGKRDRKIPPRGTTKDGLIKFRFHGIGCEVEGSDATFDFDFGENGVTGGFDAWRLAQFAKSYAPAEATRFTEASIQDDLEKLLVLGVAYAPKQEPSPHLLYFTRDRMP
jgi:hypothetical protein